MHNGYDLTDRRIDENDFAGYFQLNETDRRIKERLIQIAKDNEKKKNKGVMDSVAAFIKKIGDKNPVPEQDDASNRISITDTGTIAFQQLNRAMAELFHSNTLIEGGNQRAILYQGQPQAGNMRLFKFEVPTINLSIQNEYVLISPHYVFKFDEEGEYKCTYSPLALTASLVTYSTKEHREISKRGKRGIARQEKLVGNTTNKDIIENVLKLEIADLSLYFYTNIEYGKGFVEIASAYSDTEIQEEFDPAFHIMGLLKRCDFESKNVKRLENLVAEHDA